MKMDIREEALKLRRKHHGLLEVHSKTPLTTREELSIVYTPGVAEPCKDIKENRDLSLELTCRGNMVGIVTDGTRVLGLGDIGPYAAMPVMEGKALLFKTFGDVDAIPICIDAKEPEKFIDMVKRLEPTFGGINLEDISSPKCYDIEDALIEQMNIPVFHDDQHGTAIAAVAAVLGGLRFVRKDLKTARFVINGAGAAGTAIARLLVYAGVKNLVMIDSHGALHADRPGLNRVQAQLVKQTNLEKHTGNLAEVAKGADVLLGVSGPRLFTKEIIGNLAKDSLVFAMANPVPEVMYAEAKEAGARVVGTGRSDAPNQANNVTVFPGVFRGALDVRARRITEDMKLAAAHAIAGLLPEKDLREDFVVVDAFDPRVAPAVAAAVAKVAIETDVARVKIDPEVIRERAAARIGR
jgi:malate dehydrogenase (oxaloacetate-decarboxylating)